MTSNRGRRILELLNKNDQPIHNENYNKPVQAAQEDAPLFDDPTAYLENIQPTENVQRSHSNSSSSSSPSSASSSTSSSSSSFDEDSDDSVEDPNYTLEDEIPRPDSASILEQNFDEEQPTQSVQSDEHNIENTTESSVQKGKKRKRNESKWLKNIKKRLRNEGKPYETASKKIKAKRMMRQTCSGKCRLKCGSKMSETERQTLFDNYWKLGNLEKQREYISNSLISIEPRYRYVREGGTRKPRQKNNAFYFQIEHNKIRVCKLFYKNTLGINDRPIRTVLEKRNQDAGSFLSSDMRGKHSNHKKVDLAILTSIKEHIESIPQIESHYTRANSSRYFIDGSKSITSIYNDYVNNCKTKQIPYGSYSMFYKVFTLEYNISFFMPKKDRCDTCVIYENCQGEDKANKQDEYDRHLVEKDLCRAEKATDKENEHVVVAVYDMQAVFQCPKGDTSLFYYVSKLNVFNFTISDLNSKTVDCYVWDEATGNRGVNDLGTCVYDYLKRLDMSGDNLNIIFYSDNCVGQQKNKMMLAMYMFALQKLTNIETITHKYLIKGHTQNEVDSAHSLIERRVKKLAKGGPMYTPESFVTGIQTARTNPKPFDVHLMTHDDFLDWKDVCSQMSLNVSKDEEGNNIKFIDLKIIKVKKNCPRHIFFKTSYTDQEFKKAEVIKRKKSIEVNVKKAYLVRPGLNEKKKAGLIGLLNKNVIPKYYAPFYHSL